MIKAYPVKEHISSLPEEIRPEIVTALAVLEEESRKPEPDSSKLLAALGSIKTTCEAAAGNLVAAGIVGLASQIFQ